MAMRARSSGWFASLAKESTYDKPSVHRSGSHGGDAYAKVNGSLCAAAAVPQADWRLL